MNVHQQTAGLSAIIATQQEIVSAEMDLQRVMELVASRSEQLTGADGAAVALVEGSDLVMRAATGSVERYAGHRCPMDRGVLGQCIAGQESVLLPDVEVDRDWAADPLRGWPVQALVSVPLVHRTRAVGALLVIAGKTEAFKDDDLATLQIMAGFITWALSHAAESEAHQALIKERSGALELLRRSEARFRAIFENTGIGIVVWDVRGRLLLANRAMQDLLGYSVRELRGMHWTDIMHPDDVENRSSESEVPVNGGQVHIEFERRYLRRDGGTVWGQTHVSAVSTADGEPQFYVSMVEDVTARRQAEQALRESENRYRTLVETSPDGIVLFDPTGRVLTANPTAAELYGFDVVGHMVGLPGQEVFGDAEWPRLEELLKRGLESGEVQREEMPSSGPWRQRVPVEVRLAPVQDDGGGLRGVLGIARDISEQVKAQRALQHQALHDSLTGLPNRTLLFDRLDQTIKVAHRDGSPVALLLIDLDRFKDVNDTFGHHHGDILLQQVGERLACELRESDTVARLGGDEFAVLLPGTDLDGALQTVEKLAAAFAPPFQLENETVDVAMSVGVAVHPDHGADGGMLVRRADVAMYVAKRGHRLYSVYAEEQDQHSRQRLSLIRDLRRAVDAGQLELVYQPIVDVLSGRPVRVEALMRWNHPTLGQLSADAFIPLAEQTGQMRSLTLWLLEAAFAQCSSWRSQNIDARVAVNLSARYLHDLEIVEVVKGLFGLPALAPRSVQAEVTESALMADRDAVTVVLDQLHEMGVGVAIDDFGTGYSSLAYLRRLPIDEIKIDKQFVCGMRYNDNDRVIVRSTVDLSHNLGLSVVAEGVEDRETLEDLGRMRCDLVQGYHVSSPMPAQASTEWLRRHLA